MGKINIWGEVEIPVILLGDTLCHLRPLVNVNLAFTL
jgi:hypothetical protein